MNPQSWCIYVKETLIVWYHPHLLLPTSRGRTKNRSENFRHFKSYSTMLGNNNSNLAVHACMCIHSNVANHNMNCLESFLELVCSDRGHSSGVPWLSGSRTRCCRSGLLGVISVVTAHVALWVQAKDDFDYWSRWLTLQGVIDDGASVVTAQNSAASLLISTLGGGGLLVG